MGDGVELQAEVREKSTLEHTGKGRLGQRGLLTLGGQDLAHPHSYSLMLTVRLAAFFNS